MILPTYLIKKFFKALVVCTGISYSFFFIFSLIGNLGEKLNFKSILYLSSLNSIQIFTYIPSHIFILSLCIFIIHLKSKNELIIIKEYIDLKTLFLIISPILLLFIFIEIKKDYFSSNIERLKSSLMNSKSENITKIFISTEGNKRIFTIFYKDDKDSIIDQYTNIEIQNKSIFKSEMSSNLSLIEDSLLSNETTIYENNDFRYENIKKKLINNFTNYWYENPEHIIWKKPISFYSNYKIIKSILFFTLFYVCISMIFLSKGLVNRNVSTMKVFLSVLSIFLYFLLIPKIILNDFQYIFQILSLVIFTLIFFQIKKHE